MKMIVIYDRYGYVTEFINIEEKSKYEIHDSVARAFNIHPEALEYKTGNYITKEFGSDEEALEFQQLNNCKVAWHLGSNRCTCNLPHCPFNEDDERLHNLAKALRGE